MRRKITKIRLRFDDSEKTFVTFDKKIWQDFNRGEANLVTHRIWRITLGRSKRRRIKFFIKALFDCDFEKEVRLEKDGYSIFLVR